MDRMPEVLLEDEMQSSYLDYAMSVIIGRAIPDARDGLKPVQRRILYAMYRINNLHNQPTKKSARIVGECFVKDTLVLTDKGLVPIQHVEKGSNVYTQSGIQEVSELYIMPKRKLLRITLKNGLENTATESQKFKILTEDWQIVWKSANELKIGDNVVMRSVYPEITEEVDLGGKRLNENIAYLLGQLLSDGFVAHDMERGYHRVGFCSTSIDIINAINSCLQAEFNYAPVIEEKHQEYQSVNGQVMVSKIYQLRVSRQEISRFFIERFGLIGAKAWSKKVPDQLLRSPKRVIFAFLSGLIDGDGHIHNNRTVVEYATTSKEMANQLIVLLQHLGIHGKKYIFERGGTDGYILGRKVHLHDSFSLEFSGINALRLAQNLNLKCEEKKERIRVLLDQNLKMSDFDILPAGGRKIFSEFSDKHLGGGWYKGVDGKKFRLGIRYSNGCKIRYSSDLQGLPLHMSQILEWNIKAKLDRIGSTLSPFIESVINNGVYFCPVSTIEDGGEEVTYDIQVETSHEFVANGMISHNCIGKFHPHGDIPVYDSLVRMAQKFSMNHTLAEGQGNFGSVDGDPPAAMRYTEVRLTKMAENIIEDIDKDTVGFIPNFDNTETEPVVLPSMIPNLLVNGAYGIAVGVATSMPPHNLAEVCDAVVHILDKKGAAVEEIMGIIKGPDFPTGGIAVMSGNTYNGYKFGRGQVSVRGVVEFEEKTRKVVISEIPYAVNKATLVEAIALLVKDKRIIGVSDLRDESDKEGIRVVLDLKKDADPENIINNLYKHTQLENTVPIINLAVLGNSLKTFSIVQLLGTFIDHRRDIVRKRSQYELTLARDRVHIVEGLLITIEKIDEIVTLIKKSREVKEARDGLMHKYGISEKQANAILDMKLSRLTHLEFDSLTNEKRDLEERIGYYSGVLADPEKVDGIIRKETLEVKKEFGRPRRTKIISSSEVEDVSDEEMIVNQKVTVILTNSGYVKRLDVKEYKEQGRGGRGVVVINLKESDYVKQMLNGYTRDYVICVSDKGRVYWLRIYKIPEGSRYAEGKAIVNLLDIKDERIIGIFNIKDFERSSMLFLTKKGLLKKVRASLFSHPRAGGVRALNIRGGDELVDFTTYSDSRYIIIATKKGKIIKFDEKEIRSIGRSGMGVRGIKLRDGDSALKVITGNDTGHILTVTEKGYGKLTDINKYRLQGRGGGGTINIKVSDKTGGVAKTEFLPKVDDSKAVLINSYGIAIAFPVKSIRITGRAAKGVRLMKVAGGSRIVDLQIMDGASQAGGAENTPLDDTMR